MPTKTIWMTGCTSGLGRALVDEFTAAGHTVVGCGRRRELIEQLQHAFPSPHFFSSVDVAVYWYFDTTNQSAIDVLIHWNLPTATG